MLNINHFAEMPSRPDSMIFVLNTFVLLIASVFYSEDITIWKIFGIT